MARLESGQNEKIDRINDLVYLCRNGYGKQVDDSISTLLKMFKPMLLSICDKWSKYFNDKSHNIKSFNELMCDAEYWFYNYTMFKYDIDGAATYNKFIKDHIDQRVRYIYECEIKYYRKCLFPDPDKSGENDMDMLEQVIHNYSNNQLSNTEDSVIDGIDNENKKILADHIIDTINKSNKFNKREKQIFIEIICNGVTHEEMGKRLNISRTRVTQILKKMKIKLYMILNDDSDVWDLIVKLDLDFEER